MVKIRFQLFARLGRQKTKIERLFPDLLVAPSLFFVAPSIFFASPYVTFATPFLWVVLPSC